MEFVDEIKGEILKGHGAHYRTYYFQGTDLSDNEKNDIVDNINPRTGVRRFSNQTWQCRKINGKMYVITTFTGCHNKEIESYFYHARFFPASIDFLRSYMGDSLFFPFAAEEDFFAVSRNEIDFARTGLSGRLKRQEDVFAHMPLAPEMLGALAAHCLFLGMTNGGDRPLFILVPEEYQKTDGEYQSFCRHILWSIAQCVPYGLRQYLGFASNPDDRCLQKYHVGFLPEGSSFPEQARLVSLTREQSMECPEALSPAIFAMIKEGARQRNKNVFLDNIWKELEQNLDLRNVEQARYARYWELNELLSGRQKIDYVLLKKLNQKLAQNAGMPIKKHIKDELDKQDIFDIILLDPAARVFSSFEDLLDYLSEYSNVIRFSQQAMGERIVNNLLSRVDDRWGIRNYYILHEYRNYINGATDGKEQYLPELKQRSPRLYEKRTAACKLLHSKEFEKYVHSAWGDLEQELENTKERIGEEIRAASYGGMRSSLDALKAEYGERTYHYFFTRGFIRWIEEYLKGLRDDKSFDESYQAIFPCIPDDLRAEIQAYQESRMLSRAREEEELSSLKSFDIFIRKGLYTDRAIEKLWEYLDKQRLSGAAGLDRYISAWEWKKGKAWSEILSEDKNILLFFREFTQEHKMGICLFPKKGLDDIHSEALAFRKMAERSGMPSDAKVYVWYARENECRNAYVNIGKLLDFLNILKRKQDGENWDKMELKQSPGLYEAFAQAGYIPIENHNKDDEENSAIPYIIGITLVILLIVAVAGFFVFRYMTGGGLPFEKMYTTSAAAESEGKGAAPSKAGIQAVEGSLEHTEARETEPRSYDQAASGEVLQLSF